MTDASSIRRDAHRALGESDLKRAAELYRALLAAGAETADDCFNLAWILRAERKFVEAADSYQAAIDRGIRAPEEARVNRAAIYSDHLFDPITAEAELKAALAANPAFLPAWLNLALLFEDLGDRARATETYREALFVDPNSGRARARLANIQTISGDASAAVADVRLALETVTEKSGRAELLMALGTALDRLGSYDEAFEVFAEGKAEGGRSAKSGYDRGAQERFGARMIEAFPTPRSVSLDPVGVTPAFICGMFRSGSTLAEAMLGRHSQVEAGGEIEFFPHLASVGLPGYPAGPLPDRQTLERLRHNYLSELHRAASAGSTHEGVLTDKRCDNVLNVGLIKTLLPEAKIVNTVRHPLDNILSVFFTLFDEGVPYSYTLEDAAHYYVCQARLIEHWRSVYPKDVFDLDYDRLVTNPRSEMGRLLDYLGLAFEQGCLIRDDTQRAVRTVSGWAIRQPLHSRSSGRWRHYRRHLGGAISILASAGLTLEGVGDI